ncbi:Hypothetical_protein [Hexamita inflata]|uniref:Hypothetical_protein n=1 Tax=Hexamita inflata TaxID=28002 RepID=A0AA86N6V5_9EUKA|nr:Hypothetical protein HINF_LOCUS1782 [Hexamita inflata]CAI9952214.1 Hypothetical protein HINF_LOCUS39859 [Hexamita inflata]
MSFFQHLIQQLMDNKQISPHTLERALQMIKSPISRRGFVYELSNERGNYESQELQDTQFLILSWLFRAAFDAMLVDGKCPDKSSFDQDTLLLVNMSMTYFRLINNERQYIAETLKTHPAFQEFQFWQYAFKVESKLKFLEQQKMMGFSDPSSSQVDDTEDVKMMWRMIRMATLHFFGLAMHEFGRQKEDFELFVQYINQHYVMQLTQEERDEAMAPFQAKKQIKDKESLQMKYARLQLEKAIEHDFEVARAIQQQQIDKNALIECEIAQMLVDGNVETGLEMNTEIKQDDQFQVGPAQTGNFKIRFV